MTRAAIAALSLSCMLFACGKGTPSPVTPPPVASPAVPTTPAAPTVAPTTPAPTTPAFVATGYLAWSEDDSHAPITTLFVTAPGGAMETVGVVPGLVVGDGDRLWSLAREVSHAPLMPCGEAAEADFVALALTGLEPAAATRALALADVKQRPEPKASAMHSEQLDFVAEVGPLVLVRHETKSNTCPVPAGETPSVIMRVLDVRDGAVKAPLDLYTDAERAALDAEAIEPAIKKIRVEYPDAPAEDLRKVMKLSDLSFTWDDTGKLAAIATVTGESALFSDIIDELAVATTTVPLTTLPSALGSIMRPPGEVAASWMGRGAGRGWSTITGPALARARTLATPAAP